MPKILHLARWLSFAVTITSFLVTQQLITPRKWISRIFKQKLSKDHQEIIARQQEGLACQAKVCFVGRHGKY